MEKQVCPAMGDSAQCHNLAEGLLPTVIQWLRASATPASLCGGAGVCGAVLAQVPELNKVRGRGREVVLWMRGGAKGGGARRERGRRWERADRSGRLARGQGGRSGGFEVQVPLW